MKKNFKDRNSKQKERINQEIRAKEVRLISEDGSQVGVMPLEEALQYCEDKDLDLVEMTASANPPVCRALNYSKYRYQKQKQEKLQKKNQKQVLLHEIKMRPAIAEHDYQTKLNHIRRFLKKGDKVRVSVEFRRRESQHPDLGERLLEKVCQDLKAMCKLDKPISRQGRGFAMIVAPLSEKEEKEIADDNKS